MREGSVRWPAAAASADAVAAVVVRRRCCPSKEKYFLLGYHQIFELANYLRISCGLRLQKSFVACRL